MATNFELKQINGIPYWYSDNIIYTFQLDGGHRSSESIAIGTYDAATDSIKYYPDWKQRVESNLIAFRNGLSTLERDKLRDTLVKPVKKQRKATRNPRKSTSRTKNTKNIEC